MIDIGHPEYTISIRPTVPADAEAIYEIRRNPAVARWQYRLNEMDEPESFVRIIEKANQGTYSQYFWSVVEQERVIGHLFVTRVWDKTFAVGFNLHQEYWGRGIMPLALRATVQDTYLNRNADKICCYCFNNNLRVQRMLMRVDFLPHKLRMLERLQIIANTMCLRRVLCFVHQRNLPCSS